MSALLRPQPGEGYGAELGFVAALALHDAAGQFVDPQLLQLKWPNDVLLDGSKMSGILLEVEGEALILGIGVNLVAAPVLTDRQTAAVADYLADPDSRPSAADFAEQLAEAFVMRRRQWRDGGFAATRAAWLARAHPVGTVLRVQHGRQPLQGSFAGLAADGALQLRLSATEIVTIHAGDVWQMPAAPEPKGES